MTMVFTNINLAHHECSLFEKQRQQRTYQTENLCFKQHNLGLNILIISIARLTLQSCFSPQCLAFLQLVMTAGLSFTSLQMFTIYSHKLSSGSCYLVGPDHIKGKCSAIFSVYSYHENSIQGHQLRMIQGKYSSVNSFQCSCSILQI